MEKRATCVLQIFQMPWKLWKWTWAVGVGLRFPVILTANKGLALVQSLSLTLSLSHSSPGQQVQPKDAYAARSRPAYLSLIYYSIFNVFTNTSQAQLVRLAGATWVRARYVGAGSFSCRVCASGTVRQRAREPITAGGQFRVIDPMPGTLHLAVDFISVCVVSAVSETSCGSCFCLSLPNDSLRGPVTNLRVFIGFCGRCWMRI